MDGTVQDFLDDMAIENNIVRKMCFILKFLFLNRIYYNFVYPTKLDDIATTWQQVRNSLNFRNCT